MRALFICRTNRTKLMVHLAQILKERGELTEALAFVAYYDQWRDYLRNEASDLFKEIYGTREIFQRMNSDSLDIDELKRLEREYGANEIWNIVFSERYLAPLAHHNVYNHPKYSGEDVLRYVQICFQVAEKIFDQAQPDCIVDFAMVSIFRRVFDLVARKRGVPYLYPFSAILTNRFYICHRIPDEYRPVRNTYYRLAAEGAACQDGWRYLKQFRETDQKSAYRFNMTERNRNLPSNRARSVLKQLPGLVQTQLKQPLRWARDIFVEMRLRWSARRDPTIGYNFQLFKGVLSIRFYRSMLSWMRKVIFLLNNPFDDSPLPGDYIFMTLHLQPEASTSVLAPFFANQVSVVENVARTLPLSWKLVVKPHPSMVGVEPVSLYYHLQKIPNVRLVSPTANTRQLILGSKAVVAISGTSGFEALLLGKKAIVFGDPIWRMCRDVTQCTDFTHLHRLLQEVEDYKPDDYDLAAYLQAVHDHSFPLEENYVWKGPYDLTHVGYKQGINEIAHHLAQAYHRYYQGEIEPDVLSRA